MKNRITINILLILVLASFSKLVLAENRQLFNGHALCAAFYGKLSKAAEKEEDKKHYKNNFEDHIKMAIKVIPDTKLFKEQFERETAQLNSELSAFSDGKKAAYHLHEQVGKCAEVNLEHAKFLETTRKR